MNSFADHLYIFLLLIPIVTVHEAAHALAAHLLGDDTAQHEERLTLNPLHHIDLWGTILMPMISVFLLSGGLLAWGRPVPVDPANFRSWRRDEILVALAGPFANILLAAVAVAGLHLLPAASPWASLLQRGAFTSAFLALFNLLPLPPLDGWTILRSCFDLPHEWVQHAMVWGSLALLLLLNFSPLWSFMEMGATNIVTILNTLTGGRIPI